MAAYGACKALINCPNIEIELCDIGLQKAYKNQPNKVVHNAKDINQLILPIFEKEADVVIGTRFLNKENLNDMKFLNRTGNRFFTSLTNFLSGQKFTDTQCGFRALSRDSALNLDLMNDFNLTQEIIIDLSFKGLIIKEIPIRVNVREHGSSKIVKSPWSYGFRALNITFGTFIDHYPMRFFGFLGFIPLILGFISGVIMLLSHIDNRDAAYLFWVDFEYTIVLLLIGFFMLTVALLAKINSRNKKLLEEILYNLRKGN